LPRSRQWTFCTKFCKAGHLADVVTCFKFFIDQLRGLGSAKGRILPFCHFYILHSLSLLPLTQVCATARLWLIFAVLFLTLKSMLVLAWYNVTGHSFIEVLALMHSGTGLNVSKFEVILELDIIYSIHIDWQVKAIQVWSGLYQKLVQNFWQQPV